MKLPIFHRRLFLFPLLVLSLSTASLALAQTSGDTNSGPPPGPLLKRTPDHSIWSMTAQGSPTDEAASASPTPESGGSGDKKPVVVTQSKLMKSGNTIYEQNVDDHGKVHQIWHIGGVRAEKGSDGSPSITPDAGGGGDIYSVNFGSCDFAGLDWISADTYQGKAKYQGRDVLIFEKKMNPLPADENRANAIENSIAAQVKFYNEQHGIKSAGAPRASDVKLVPVVATIDLETRLPLLVTFGGQTRVYGYAPLTSAIPVPEDIAAAVANYQRRLKILSQ